MRRILFAPVQLSAWLPLLLAAGHITDGGWDIAIGAAWLAIAWNGHQNYDDTMGDAYATGLAAGIATRTCRSACEENAH
jgi:hypothetical protein